MTKKLNWRLKDLPTGDEVAQLVEQKVITAKEARELLFNEGKDNGKKVKELEEEVQFLRDLCDKLAAKSNGWTTIIKEVQRYTPHYPVWYNSYQTVSPPSKYTITAGSYTGSNIATGVGSGTLTMSSQSAPKMLGKLN